ncbi:short-chain dehydrogenase/reductase SDR [Paenibacillus curdlanolyticus YK9]|uniref:Short-chain dehydrogenase/reductase SDR n=1 Tax=Paenibacillus curdlanolyticus YK9 TaxID=717606 RepID=E0I5C5_9BACL|nr:SDR family oxidoreductase [Paenibacillus curdlanolyticus]EFM12167.1 short-chain dehydrogenase/reductase SDR [Paenibacillus curdlanolyticus YK9]
MKINVQNRNVMITGAGAGIGRQLALAYAKHGANVILVDKQEEALRQTVQLIQHAGVEPLWRVVDLSDANAIAACFVWLESTVGHLDILINNAGFGITKSLFDLTIEEWDSVLNTNLRGTFLCAREAAKLMKKAGAGAIVNLASTRALMSEPDTEAYAASKGGIVALTHAMAVSLGPDRIRVNAISPGWIETGDYEQLREIDHRQHPAQRVGKPDDIVRACFYLTDPDNDFVTGTNLVVDGGMTSKMIYEE